jgi:hypothetical protein
MLAVVWITSESLFLTDGILIIETKPQKNLKNKLQHEPGFDLELGDLEGFVCLFENCRINITSGSNFSRPEEGDLAKMFRKKDFRSEVKRGECDSNGQGKLSNMEKGEMRGRHIGFEMINRTVINVEDLKKKKKTHKVKKKISKKRKRKRKRTQSMSTEDSESSKKLNDIVNPVINFLLEFDTFSVICPNGKHFLSGKREMIVDSLSYEQVQFFERKFKLEKHINKMKNAGNDSLVPVLEIGDIIGNIQCAEIQKNRNSSKEDNKTRTSTPSGDLKESSQLLKRKSKIKSKKRRNKRMRRA